MLIAVVAVVIIVVIALLLKDRQAAEPAAVTVDVSTSPPEKISAPAADVATPSSSVVVEAPTPSAPVAAEAPIPSTPAAEEETPAPSTPAAAASEIPSPTPSDDAAKAAPEESKEDSELQISARKAAAEDKLPTEDETIAAPDPTTPPVITLGEEVPAAPEGQSGNQSGQSAEPATGTKEADAIATASLITETVKNPTDGEKTADSISLRTDTNDNKASREGNKDSSVQTAEMTSTRDANTDPNNPTD